MNMAETMMPQVNLGAGTVLADTLFPQETAGETLRKQELAKEKTYETALKKEITNKWKRTLTGWLLLAPSLVFLCAFTIYPIVKSIISSFYLDNLSVMQPVFAGFSNYIALFQDKVYWECFWNNLLIAVITVPLSIGLAVAMAMFANSLKWGKAAARLGFTYPTFIPLVAAANIWMFIYTPIYGLLGYINPNWRFLGRRQDSHLGGHGHAGLEAGRLYYAVLCGGTSWNFQRTFRSSEDRRSQRLADLYPRNLAHVKADDHLRADHHTDQCIQDGGSPLHHDQGRPRQCHECAAVLYLPDRL